MTAVALAVVVLAALVVGLMLLAVGAVVAWRRERRQVDLLAESLLVDGRLETLTIETLAAMRRVTREHLALRRHSSGGGSDVQP